VSPVNSSGPSQSSQPGNQQSSFQKGTLLRVLGVALVAAALLVLLAVMILVAKAYDLSRRREKLAVSLEARISDSLRADPSLSSLPVAPTVSIPLWRGSPVLIAMTGSVPHSQFRHAALEVALREAMRSARSYRLEDRIMIDPAMARRAA